MTRDELIRAILAAIRERGEHATLRDAALRSESVAKNYRTYLEALQLYERAALANAQTRNDPSGAAILLVGLAIDLADGLPLSAQARHYISNGLLEIAKSPSSAGAAFGLVQNRGRKFSWKTDRRRAEIANFMAAVAKEHGLPIRPSASGPCAAEIAAAKYNVSVDMARSAYYEFRPHFESENDLPDDEAGEG